MITDSGRDSKKAVSEIFMRYFVATLLVTRERDTILQRLTNPFTSFNLSFHIEEKLETIGMTIIYFSPVGQYEI